MEQLLGLPQLQDRLPVCRSDAQLAGCAGVSGIVAFVLKLCSVLCNEEAEKKATQKKWSLARVSPTSQICLFLRCFPFRLFIA